MFKNFTEELNAEFVMTIQNLSQFKSLDFFYIINAYNRVMSGSTNYFDAWVYENQNKWCVGFCIEGNYLLNSKNLNKDDLILINERINFISSKTDSIHFAGNTDLIDSLSEINKNFILENFKERYFYVANKLNKEMPLNIQISYVNKNEIEKTAVLYQKYYLEEYNGVNNKSLEEVIENINYLISKDLIYILKIDDEIIGFCSKMSFLSNHPNMIGTIFIDESFRNRKFAQLLLTKVSKDLLKNNKEIYLMTTKENVSSNKMVEKVGFIMQYEHSDRIMRKN